MSAHTDELYRKLAVARRHGESLRRDIATLDAALAVVERKLSAINVEVGALHDNDYVRVRRIRRALLAAAPTKDES